MKHSSSWWWIYLMVASGVFGQGFEVVVGGLDDDRGIFATETRDGGFVAVGSTHVGNDQVFLVKVDRAGEVLWSESFGGDGDDWGWSVHEVEEGFVVAGSTSSLGAGGFDCYVAETDANGRIVWQTSLGGPRDDHCWAMVPDPGGWVVVGETIPTGQSEPDCFVAGIGPKGETRWSSSFGGPESDRCFSIQPNGDGWIAAGATFSLGAGDRDLWLVGIDSTGRRVWERTWGGEASDVAHWVAPTDDGNFLVTGYTTSFATSGDDPFLVKVDPEGGELWTRQLPFASYVHTLTGVARKGGGFLLTGFEVTSDERAALLIRIDEEGEAIETRRFVPTRGESGGYTVQPTSDGGCVLAGHTTEGSQGGKDLLLIKVP